MQELKKLRAEIDKIDIEILSLLSQRFDLSLAVAKVKQKNELEIFNPERELEILENLKKIAKEKELREDTIKEIFLEIFSESKKIQREFISSSDIGDLKEVKES